MAATTKEVRIPIDTITMDRYSRLNSRGDHSRIAEVVDASRGDGRKFNSKLIKHYMEESHTAPTSVAVAIKEFYEQKELTMQSLETPSK